MALRANPSVIGGFVLGGIALFIAALFVFGGMNLFKKETHWVTYFEGSVEGLAVGAPVNFRGVRIGQVTDVKLVVDAKKLEAHIPVYFEIDRGLISWIGGMPEHPRPHDVIAAGMRAKLAMQSLVTGQMFVELDVLPNTPGHLVGADTSVPEIPSVPSDVAILKERLEKLPLEALVTHMDQLTQNLDRLVTSPDVGSILKAAASTLNETQVLVANLNQTAIPLLREASGTLRELSAEGKATLNQYRDLAGTAGTAVGDMRTALRSATRALDQAQATLASVNGLVATDTATRNDIDGMLDNLNKASSSLRAFADTVERNPNALVIGK